ncbi:glycosyltransferase [Aeromonas dhakensis]|uniref:glycosyltransferase n=1 Tax=Aeromonas dhakensis TaxID=196024 RepID=UPI001CEFFA58|nr:glycosyltransferase [Aeromonas dhakensis]UCM43847.1 glycosyltransferase [Aeromonas dhakensis]
MVNNIAIIRSSAFKTTRVIRQAKELVNTGRNVTIIHWERMIDKEHNDNVIAALDFDCQVVSYNRRCEYGKGIYSFLDRLGWFIFLLKSVCFGKFNIVQAVDFDSAFPAFLASKFKGNKFVYDIADFIETFDSNIPSFVRAMVRKLSSIIVKFSDLIIIPDKNRFVNIEERDRDKVVIVNNAPNLDLNKINFQNIDIGLLSKLNELKTNVFYYGAFNEDRAIRLFLEASKDTRLSNVNFWFAGWGALEKEVNKFNGDNVHYLGRLKQVDALSVLSEMDCSLIFYDPAYEHNRLASPNKIFEAMAVGVPVLVSLNTSIDKLVVDENIGYACDYELEDLILTLIRVQNESQEVKAKNIKSLYRDYCWDNSAFNLREAYDRLR